MEQSQITKEYIQAVKAIKQAILESRYRAARLVNKELLALYYAIGGFISVRSRTAQWGTNAIGVISELLQQELPGLRGFSETNIKRMRIFYEEWRGLFENRPPEVDELTDVIIPMGSSFINYRKDPGSRTTTINASTGIPVKSVERHLSELSRVGIIHYQGSKKTGGYYIANQDNNL